MEVGNRRETQLMIAYNTIKEKLILREYGRNIQDLVAYLSTIEGKEERSKKAGVLVDLMRQINPAMTQTPEVEQKLWDDLHIISNFTLDVDGLFPTPSRAILEKKPDRIPYVASTITFKHFGRNVELFVEKAITIEDVEERETAIVHVGRLMKTFFYTYSRDSIEDSVIYNNIRKLSGNRLEIDLEKVSAGNLFEPQRKDRRNDRSKNKSYKKRDK